MLRGAGVAINLLDQKDDLHLGLIRTRTSCRQRQGCTFAFRGAGVTFVAEAAMPSEGSIRPVRSVSQRQGCTFAFRGAGVTFVEECRGGSAVEELQMTCEVRQCVSQRSGTPDDQDHLRSTLSPTLHKLPPFTT